MGDWKKEEEKLFSTPRVLLGETAETARSVMGDDRAYKEVS